MTESNSSSSPPSTPATTSFQRTGARFSHLIVDTFVEKKTELDLENEKKKEAKRLKKIEKIKSRIKKED
ncbi:hypothetical protein HDU92_003240 [Lobulomyces angularis]|nr:hypothetical protein HDU92_003240 [Lobulomyces angularis]